MCLNEINDIRLRRHTSLTGIEFGILEFDAVKIPTSGSNALLAHERWHSHCFIARYAQTTPTGNYATSGQPFLDLR